MDAVGVSQGVSMLLCGQHFALPDSVDRRVRVLAVHRHGGDVDEGGGDSRRQRPRRVLRQVEHLPVEPNVQWCLIV